MISHVFTALGFLLLSITGSSDLTIRPGETLCGEVGEDAPEVSTEGLSEQFREPLFGIPVRFTAAESGRYILVAESLESDLFLALYGEKGELLTDCDDGPVWIDSRIDFDATEGQSYTIQVCVLQEIFGCFTLRAMRGEASDSPPEKAVDAGLARGREAVAHCEEKFGVDGFNTLSMLNKLGLFYQDAERYDEARKCFKRTMKLVLARHGEEHWLAGRAHLNIGVLHVVTGNVDQGVRSLSRAVEIIGESWKSESAEHVGYVNCLCHVLVNNNRHREAIPRIIELIALCEEVHGAKHVDTARAHLLLGDAYYYGGLTGAVGSYEKGLEILEACVGESDEELLQPLADVAHMTLHQIGDPGAALPFIERGLRISIGLHGEDDVETSSWRYRLAACHLKAGDIAQAERILGKLVAEDSGARKELEKDKYRLSMALEGCARLEAARACWLDSLRYAREALALREESEGVGDSSTAGLLEDIATCLDNAGRSAEALPYREKALDVKRSAWGESHPFTANTLSNLGALFLKLGRVEDARKSFEKVVAIRRKALGPAARDTFEARLWLAVVLGRSGRHEKAERALDALLAESRKAMGRDNLFTARVCGTLAAYLKSAGPVERVRPLYEEAIRIREAVQGKAHSETIEMMRTLARYLFAEGYRDEASELFQEALKRSR